MNTVAARLRVYGRVQGVGYRYYCLRKAKPLSLTGWVKNDPDGAVTVVVEGDRSSIEALIDELKVGPSSANVTDVSVDWREFSGRFSQFEVTF